GTDSRGRRRRSRNPAGERPRPAPRPPAPAPPLLPRASRPIRSPGDHAAKMTRKASGGQRHHVDSQVQPRQSRPPARRRLGRADQTLVLIRPQSQRRRLQRGATFDLDSGQNPPAPGQDVDLSAPPLQPKGQHLIPLEHQPQGGDPFGGMPLTKPPPAQPAPPARLRSP